ncbi:MFS transporter [Microtetraspora sp. NBRC 16547]|uniref:MFS transporter n=1 Tax=Microtetraspora sp. NBRC 16547 TaxID=3030993 RepID=UPI002557830C|nr:MFS transporter [Microtetraspora sp. NBRC 16547]
MRARLPLRLTRAAAFSAVCVGLGVFAHRFAGGAGPTPGALAVGGTVIMAAAAVLAGRERSRGTITALLAGAQLFLHLLLSRSAEVDGLAVPAHSHRLGVEAGMVAAHLTATLVTGWWLARGETALWCLLRRLGASALRPLTAGHVPPAPVVPFVRITAAPVRLTGRTLKHALVVRGPPVLSAF